MVITVNNFFLIHSMKSNNRETLRIRIYSYYEKYKNFGKKFTIDHFISEGEKLTTIYDIINRFQSGKNAKHQSGDGRPTKIFNKQAKKKPKRLVNNKPHIDGVSQRKLAGCFKCTQSYVNRVIKSMGI